MIQAISYDTDPATLGDIKYYINIYDKYDIGDAQYKPRVTITSQFTGNSKTFLNLTTDWTNKERYVYFLSYVVSPAIGENLSTGLIELGNDDFPYGFYDVTIYENSSNTNLNPSGLSVVYTGLLNLTAASGEEEVVYKENTVNDSDTASVYVTI